MSDIPDEDMGSDGCLTIIYIIFILIALILYGVCGINLFEDDGDGYDPTEQMMP